MIAFVFDTGGSRNLVNNEINTNMLEKHKYSCIPIEALVPILNKTPDNSVPISFLLHLPCNRSLRLDLRFPCPYKQEPYMNVSMSSLQK